MQNATFLRFFSLFLFLKAIFAGKNVMLINIFSAKCIGINAVPVTVEVDITSGIGIHLVGLADVAVKESLLYKRVVNSLSLKKVGSRMLPVFERIASALPCTITEDDGERVFHRENEEEEFRPTPDSSTRYSYQIPTEEAVYCLKYILEREGRIMTKSELSRLFKEELGYERMGAQVDALFRKAARSPLLKRTGNGRYMP